MVKHTQAIRRQQPTNCLSVFDHFLGLALKGLTVLLNSQENTYAKVSFLTWNYNTNYGSMFVTIVRF